MSKNWEHDHHAARHHERAAYHYKEAAKYDQAEEHEKAMHHAYSPRKSPRRQGCETLCRVR